MKAIFSCLNLKPDDGFLSYNLLCARVELKDLHYGWGQSQRFF